MLCNAGIYTNPCFCLITVLTSSTMRPIKTNNLIDKSTGPMIYLVQMFVKRGGIMHQLLKANFATDSSLIHRAAFSRDIQLRNEPRKFISRLEFDSMPVGIFTLDNDFITALQKQGFIFEVGKKPPHDTMRYLSGNSNQRGAEIFESDCWAWKREETKHEIEIYFRLSVSEQRRGVVCVLHSFGNCSGGPCHQPTINRFVKVVAEYFPNVHSLIADSAIAQNSQAVISWSSFGEAGIKSVELLFDELYGKNEKNNALACSTLSPFDPNPYARKGPIWEPKDRIFIPEKYHSFLFEQ